MPGWEELRTARREGSLAAQRARRRLGLSGVRRVDVFDVIDAQGVWLMFQPLQALYGFYRRLGDTAGIVVHSGHPLSLQRYTAAHELAHHLLGHAYSLDEAGDVGGAPESEASDLDAGGLAARAADSVGDPLQEAAAQAFAATFLMPIQMINHALVDRGHDRDHPNLTTTDVYGLSLEFGASYEAMLTQLAVLEKITWPEAKTLRLPPIQIKTMLAGGRRPADARADLWLVHDRDRGRSFPLRVGDEVLIRLPEIPSSGYAWRPVGQRWSTLGLVEERVEAVSEDELVLGGAVQRVMYLRAISAGQDQLAVELVRPWEDSAADRVTFQFDVAAAPTGDTPVGLLERQQRRRVLVA